ncbi:unnamed protein product [Rhizophagus irregularis]|uniref:Uncharacterized protein n=1 Tax=Rhizophagus irregularis TaxID=588596 RepID=A0A916EAX1_9GLOM|nr:unnamed protein product [Rhizophagus irregularis]CAB5193609.1 unnamed protein product [Rhizophagus irregularis]CAB5373123.1 unnamed protein product [Rhizophagus irregularis]
MIIDFTRETNPDNLEGSRRIYKGGLESKITCGTESQRTRFFYDSTSSVTYFRRNPQKEIIAGCSKVSFWTSVAGKSIVISELPTLQCSVRRSSKISERKKKCNVK